MRTVIILILSASAMFGQTASLTPEQARERTAARSQQLSQVWMEERTLEKKMAELRARYSDSHPEVVATQAQLQRLRTLELDLSSEIWVRSGAATLNEKAAAAERLDAVKAREAELEARLGQLRGDHPDIGRLTQELDSLRLQERVMTGLSREEDRSQREAKSQAAQEASLKIGDGSQPNTLDHWWRNGALAQSLSLTADQQKRMDDVLQQYRLKLVDVNGALQKEEIALEPLVGADRLDETKITAQIDRVAQARAELEKVNGRMLLQIRKQLTPDQWRKLNQSAPGARP